jgi:hypothetical protein
MTRRAKNVARDNYDYYVGVGFAEDKARELSDYDPVEERQENFALWLLYLIVVLSTVTGGCIAYAQL